MLLLIVFCAGVSVVALWVLTAVAFVVARRHPLGWRLYRIAALAQLAVNAGLMIVVLDDFPSAAAVIFPGIVAGIAAISAGLGLLLYIVLCLVFMRPPYWKRWLAGLGGVVSAAILAIAIPRLIVSLGMVPNVELHGIVYDVHGEPVPGATVHLGNCAYLEENPVVADASGRFQIGGTCRGYLLVRKILNPQTGTACVSRFRSSDHEYLLVFDSLDGKPYSQSRPHWRGYPADNPFAVNCAWSVPETIERRRGGYKELGVDTELVTVGPDPDRRYLRFQAGENDGWLKLRLRIVADGETAADRFELEIAAIDGGIQATTDREPFNIAPLDAYQPSATLDLGIPNEDPEQGYQRANQVYYFHSHDRAVYGAVRVYSIFEFNRRTGTFAANPSITVDVFANYGGSHVLLSQVADRQF